MPDYHNKREKELQEIDMYDVMVPELAIPYQKRLQGVSDFLDTQLNYKQDRAKDIRRYILNESGVAGGETNFWANPYQHFPKKTPTNIVSISYLPIVGGVMGHMPTTMRINSNLANELSFPASSLLPHESHHIRQFLADTRKAKGQLDPEFSYKPKFSDKFMDKLYHIANKEKNSPYYMAGGFGADYDETMSYFVGREGNLRQGKSLRDDPETKPIWDAYPGMYEEYVRSRDLLRKTIN